MKTPSFRFSSIIDQHSYILTDTLGLLLKSYHMPNQSVASFISPDQTGFICVLPSDYCSSMKRVIKHLKYIVSDWLTVNYCTAQCTTTVAYYICTAHYSTNVNCTVIHNIVPPVNCAPKMGKLRWIFFSTKRTVNSGQLLQNCGITLMTINDKCLLLTQFDHKLVKFNILLSVDVLLSCKF